jgi:dUTP pyrophosphatase
MEKVLFRKTHSEAKIPTYQTSGSAGADVYAVEQDIIHPGEVKAIPLGLEVQIPEGYEIQVRPRSGLALKNKITVLNSPGTIDADFRNECKVILANMGEDRFVIKPGDRIAQFVLNKVERIEFEETDTLSETDRKGGFGSTGVS